jgi:2-methoxy-6-polyprenyl-1,4-benzoquinol methylase
VSSRSLRLRCAAGSQTSMLVASTRLLSNAKADFGFRDVDAEEKERLVKDVFSKVAEKYDIMNDVMSFGTHRLWKDELVSMLGIPAAARANPNVVPRHLDVAGGTGDVAFRSLNQMLSSYGASALASEAASGPKMDSNRQIVVCDINPDMLKVGKQRAEKQYRNNGLDMVSPHSRFCVVSTLILCRPIRY